MTAGRTKGPSRSSRRDEYAALTRQAVVDVSRRLFAEYGYERTTVQAIAAEARVSPSTIYAQCGGKEGVLGSLMDLWTTGDLVQTIIEECAALPSPREKLRRLAEGYVQIYRESGDIAGIVGAAATTTPAAADFLRVANERHREALRTIIEPIERTGGLRDGLDSDEAAEIVFFHFRWEQFSLAVTTFGWGEEKSVEWLLGRVESAILR